MVRWLNIIRSRIFQLNNNIKFHIFTRTTHLQIRHRSTMTEPEAKYIKSTIKIGTHNGVFHCDEILACYMLKRLPIYKDAEIIRTRDLKELDSCDIVLDVGGVYDPSKHRYDHHQRNFNESMNSLNPEKPWKTKLSSAGLVYFHFGHKLLRVLLGDDNVDLLNTAYNKIYEYFIQEIDGIDNGVPMFNGEPNYRITTNLSSRIANLNSPWNAKNVDQMAGFYKGFELIGKEFEDKLDYISKVWWPARSLVKQAVDERFQIHPSGEIMELPGGQACPWKEHFFDLENELQIEPKLKFVLFKGEFETWRVQAVPTVEGSYICRVGLREEWGGLRDEELSTTAGIDGCVFVHSTWFIGGNETRDGALKMAIKSLERRDKSSEEKAN